MYLDKGTTERKLMADVRKYISDDSIGSWLLIILDKYDPINLICDHILHLFARDLLAFRLKIPS